MNNILEKYGYNPDKQAISRSLEAIGSNLERLNNSKVLKECFSFMDLTSLGTTDSVSDIEKFTSKVNSFAKDYPDYPLPASVCVYPNLASVVKRTLKTNNVKVTAVAGCFPTSQSFIEVKVKEVEMAIEAGADEIDIVIALNKFLACDLEGAEYEIRAIRDCIDKTCERLSRKVVLKVIIETGLLVSLEKIAEAAFISMEAGADFIKTSTGKVDVNATPTSAYVMCQCIHNFYEKTGRKVGFKAAGGISKAIDAITYYSIVDSVLGKDWLNVDSFRLGVSRLANSLLTAIEEKTVTYF